MTDFNLVRDPWIPFGPSTMSIRDALARAHELPGWPGGDCGLVETVLRLLVPMIYRITGLDDPKVGRDDELFAERQMVCFKQGHFDKVAVDAYLDRWHDRFWLLGAPQGARPFAQDPLLDEVPPQEAAKAVTSWASGDGPILGPHDDTKSLTPIQAAQSVLPLRLYSLHGTCARHPSTGKKRGYGSAGPLRNTMSVHPVGSTLAETLIGHLVPLPGGDTTFGVPFWEYPTSQNIAAPYRDRSGLLEQIAGRQDKTMLLHADEGRVTGFTIAEGPGVDRTLYCEDPYLVLDVDGHTKKPTSQKAFWRESESLLREAKDRSGQREAHSRILDWASGEYSDLYFKEHLAWAIISHLGHPKAREMEWYRSVTPDLLYVFKPKSKQNALDFLNIANDAETCMIEQLNKAWKKMGKISRKTNWEDKEVLHRPARAEFWQRNEHYFWQTVKGDVTQREIKDRIRLHALAGFDLATDRSVRNQRALPAIVESRKWIERWERPNGSADQQSASDEQEQIS